MKTPKVNVSVFLFASTALTSAFLLFSVQPMLAKMALPYFGGSAAVWNTSMVFFQLLLLAGYAYAHLISRFPLRIQALIHGVIFFACVFFLPVTFRDFDFDASSPWPALELLKLLFATAGLPFFILSATAPLLQKWYAQTQEPHAENPYFLYGASNLGSITALLSYPLLIEPLMSLSRQTHNWSHIFYSFSALIAACFFFLFQKPSSSKKTWDSDGASGLNCAPWRWVFLSFIPSSLMLGVTNYISQDLASVPLIWMIPLLLYLVTFVLAFGSGKLLSVSFRKLIFPALLMLTIAAVLYHPIRPLFPLMGLHLIFFFTAAWLCHGTLYQSRPAPAHLTAYYFWIAMGGMLGGFFNALIAPMIFTGIYEYPITILLTSFLIVPTQKSKLDKISLGAIPVMISILITHGLRLSALGAFIPLGAIVILILGSRRPVIFALLVSFWALACAVDHGLREMRSTQSQTIFQDRSFFGISRVKDERDFRSYLHGVTIHGMQYKDPAKKETPLAYYHPQGPCGDLFKALRAQWRGAGASIAVIGLGTGSAAAYGEPLDHWTFFEIDPLVQKIAGPKGYFDFIEKSKAAEKNIILGDGRLRLNQSKGPYDLILIDAFSSDSIPTHFLTAEAFALYSAKLSEGGAIAFHISSRHFNLAPVISSGAGKLNLMCLVRVDSNTEAERSYGKLPSTWAIVTSNKLLIEALSQTPGWKNFASNGKRVSWTDQYSNILSVLK